MAQFSVKIMRLTGSVLSEKQQSGIGIQFAEEGMKENTTAQVVFS